MLTNTRDAAAALLEDVRYLREVLGRVDPSRGELRRLSSIIRRILVERDLTKVAAPRIGRFLLTAPDNNPIYKAEGNQPYLFFASGGFSAFGIWWGPAICERSSTPRALPDFHPDKIVKLRIDGFLSQRVLCIMGRWVSRGAAIKYVANTASGVHSGSPQTADQKALARISRCLTYSTVGAAARVKIDLDALETKEQALRYTRTAVDPVLLEMLAASRYLIMSEDMTRLETVLVAELEQS